MLIAGPTASGKSALALRIAEEAGRRGRQAIVVNADAMQVYDALRLLTARPTPEDESRAPHRLYGLVPAATRYSVGAWLRDVRPVVERAWTAGDLPILVGGTGLYFKALTEGLVSTPDVPQAIRDVWLHRLAAQGPAPLHAHLAALDPVGAKAVRPEDPSRIVRALEVLEATGRPLRAWRAESGQRSVVGGEDALRIVMEMDRDELYARIDERVERMVQAGALDEVEALLGQEVDPGLPAMKAIGVREFAAVLRGEAALPDAVESAKRETRRYAKRQMTWFRNQMPDWPRLRS